MKKLTLITVALLSSVGAYAQNAPDTGKLPEVGIQFGGKGADGKFHFIQTTNAGLLKVDPSAGTFPALSAGENYIGQVGGMISAGLGSFVRPADTTAYAVGDLVANSTTAGSVTPVSLTLGRGATGPSTTGLIRRIRLRKSGTSVTNASFRVHFWSSSPTPSNGDNGAWLTNGYTNYAGAIDVTIGTVFTDGAVGEGVPTVGSEIGFYTQTMFALIEARGAYTPASGETFSLFVEVLQN